MRNRRFIGAGRIIDFNKDGTTCRVRLCGDDGVPMGNVFTGVRFVSDDAELTAFAIKNAPVFSNLSDHDLDTAARQNLYYNSHNPVVIE